MSADDEFDIDLDSLELNEEDLKKNDEQFLQSVQHKQQDKETEDENDVFTFWFLIVLLLLFMFLLIAGMFLYMKKRNKKRNNTVDSVLRKYQYYS